VNIGSNPMPATKDMEGFRMSRYLSGNETGITQAQFDDLRHREHHSLSKVSIAFDHNRNANLKLKVRLLKNRLSDAGLSLPMEMRDFLMDRWVSIDRVERCANEMLRF